MATTARKPFVVTRQHSHGGRRYAYHAKHGWLAWHKTDIHTVLDGWLPVSEPAHIKHYVRRNQIPAT